MALKRIQGTTGGASTRKLPPCNASLVNYRLYGGNVSGAHMRNCLLFVCLLLAVAPQPVEAQPAPCPRFEGLIRFAIKEGGPPVVLQARFSKALGISDNDVTVYRAAAKDAKDPSVLRSVDVPVGTQQGIFFLRRGDVVTMWLLSPQGQIMRTIKSGVGIAPYAVSNAQYSAGVTEICSHFATLLSDKTR